LKNGATDESIWPNDESGAIYVGGPRPLVDAVRQAVAELDVADPSGGHSVMVEITVYDVQLPVRDIGALSIKDLQDAAATETGLLTALKQLGDASELQHFAERIPGGRETSFDYLSHKPTTQYALRSQDWFRERSMIGREAGQILVRPRFDASGRAS